MIIKAQTDLIGEIYLYNNSGKLWDINNEYWGHANLEGQIRQDSYLIKLLDQEKLCLGERAKAKFYFKFSSHLNFDHELDIGQILYLNEGARTIGEFLIEKILNENLIKKQKC